MKFPFFSQFDSKDCGAACLQMVAKFYGKKYSLQTLRDYCYISREGVSMRGLSEAAESIGFRTLNATLPLENFIKDAPLPFIAFWRQSHFVVIYKISKTKVYVADPASGLVTIDIPTLKKAWLNTKINGEDVGLALFLEPTPEFYLHEEEKAEHKARLRHYLLYLKPYKSLFVQLGFAMILSSIFALIFPFLSQSMIDIGINQQNLSFINLILISELVLQTSVLLVEYIKGWIFLHMGTRISLSIISDFLIKTLKLPYSFFEARSTGDIIQRIGDHGTIQNFLTSTALSLIFSAVNFIIFGIILIYYNLPIFLIFLAGNAIYFLWTILFLKERKRLNYKSFTQSSERQNALLQLLQGVQEIKLQNCEQKKRWEWERVQVNQFKISIESLRLGQIQQTGAFFIDQVKNIFISYYAAKSVLTGEITLGMMLSISYIIGQLSGPISQAISLVLSLQDTRIALERLNEVHGVKNEQQYDQLVENEMPEDGNIYINNVTFQYGGPSSAEVLKDITLTIPENKITAIVGTSGSGKTTLVKLLLKLYKPTKGDIHVSNTNLELIDSRYWRSFCGNVSQDGFLFSDTIANNISVADETVNKDKLLRAVEVANIKEFIESLPLKYNTKVGQNGNGISHGQKQRLQIARAVYRNPKYVFLDEATNALDAHNEKTIIENMSEFLKNKTVVIVAHRLSTIRNADQIVVLDKGVIKEMGTHKELLGKMGPYYSLVKDQLEL
ncbi:peptidase domain-containing ABC transporter [Chitinophaga sp.]|uniref:peptidase domain-containing ABC transporter n=1 Tax=Chitinophaga sp. TaxID=1869181 RepID=UPI002F95650A